MFHRTPWTLQFFSTDGEKDCSEEGLDSKFGANGSLKPVSSSGRKPVSQRTTRSQTLCGLVLPWVSIVFLFPPFSLPFKLVLSFQSCMFCFANVLR